MKNKVVTILSIITNIILITILCSFIRINGIIIKEKQIIKEMSESTQVTNLNNQINALNIEHTDYMQYVQTCKAQLASAITEMGVKTSDTADIDTMTSNIRSISGKSGVNIKLIDKSITVTKDMLPLYMANGRYGTSGALYRASLNGVSPIPNDKVRIISGSDSNGWGSIICELLVNEGDVLSTSSYKDGYNVIAY